MTTTQRPAPLMTPAEVAFEYNVDPKTVTRWAKSGKLPQGEAWIMTPGGHRRYVRTWIEQQMRQAPQATGQHVSYLACGDHVTGPAALDPGTPVHCETHGVTSVTRRGAE